MILPSEPSEYCQNSAVADSSVSRFNTCQGETTSSSISTIKQTSCHSTSQSAATAAFIVIFLIFVFFSADIVESVVRSSTADGLRIRFQQHVDEARYRLLHVFARHAHNVAVRNRLLRQRFIRDDA